MQKGFYFDQTRCTGCYTCLIACKDWHDCELEGEPANWIKVSVIERGIFPDLFVAFLAQPCYHCDNPGCVPACPVEAISKREEDGIVVVDRDACMGNEDCEGHCKSACPYDSPVFGPEKGAKMQKCDLCLPRWNEGREPICVEACPMFALDAGVLEALKSKYKGETTAEGFLWSEELTPSVIFKPRKKSVSN